MPEENFSIMFMKPGMKANLFGGNCVMVKCKDENDAIIFLETLKRMDGKVVTVESREEENG